MEPVPAFNAHGTCCKFCLLINIDYALNLCQMCKLVGCDVKIDPTGTIVIASIS